MALKLSFTIEAIDRATARVRAVNNLIGRITAPVRKVRESLRSLGVESGLPKIATAAGAVRDRFRDLNATLGTIRNGLLYAAGAAAGLFYALKGVATAGERAVNNAQKVGMSVEDYQRSAYAAELAGMSNDEYSESLKFLSRNAVSAALGSEESAVWFRRAGVSVKDANGKLKPANQLLAELSDKISAMPDGLKKNALAMGLFGRSGDGTIELLNMGSKGMREAGREAEAFGLVNEAAARRGEAFNKGLIRTYAAVRGVRDAIGDALFPVLQPLLKGIQDWAVANRVVIASRFKEWLTEVTPVLRQVWDGLKAALGILWQFIKAINFVVQLIGGWQTVLVGIAAVIVGKLVFALGALTLSVIKFGIVLLTTPIGWFMLAVAGLAGLAYVVIKNWEKVKGFFAGLIRTVFWPLIQVLNLVNALLPDSVRQGTAVGRALNSTLNWVNGTQATSPLGAPASAAAARVGGTIKIEFDDRGRPRVRDMRSDNPDVDLEVYAGPILATP